jgi:hypothetical protein
MALNLTVPNLPIPGQTFRNLPKPNFQPAIYALAIREPSPSFGLVAGYTFPLSPRSIRKEFAAMGAFFDVAGSPAQLGIERQIDQFGNTPVIYTISGTPGWQFHGSDGYSMSGTASMQALEALLAQYAELNQIQIENGLPDLYVLEFYDYFTGEFWEVVPLGRQGLFQDAQQPLLIHYRFRLVGVRRLDGPPIVQIADALALAFDLTQAQAAESLNLNLVQMATYYSGVTYALAGGP